ncbi:hypothetical protein P9VFCI_228 [Rhizobium phage P9VFCI]|uniref:Uncharacterized protein n=2 Tax=Innesvirus TaxID=3044739 RepID=A0A076YQ29_9CAUD|nr:hypothetical protein P10VF_063 [Rhizobium phage vB_RleM_P10VF]YP_010662121.1 hypothetical protein PP937_gp228 [Rhizobium phage P9VFCI]AIK68276.1 hypothetical protein P10VF_063 [Rhizobium phage vB_RleM_P10VF]QNH72015.1 hypothetical protein P9VFCI_228 [Rhizobium phage P9VFCI]
MFASWIKILPYFIVVFLAKRHCERFVIQEPDGSKTYATIPFSSKEVIVWEYTDEIDSFSYR